MLKNAIAVILCIALSSCSRPETPEYFSKVTGLSLCSSSSVRNVNANEKGRSPGFDSIYIVDLGMSKACERQLFAEAEVRLGQKCLRQVRCSGNDVDGNFLKLEKMDEWIRVTYSS